MSRAEWQGDRFPDDAAGALDRYRVELLAWAQLGPDGVAHREGIEARLLPWDRVLHASAAQVGEPEGVSTVVFDLLIERKADACLVRRFDADLGDDARAAAHAIVAALGRARCSRSLLALADEGAPGRSYEDLERLAAGSLADLGL